MELALSQDVFMSCGQHFISLRAAVNTQKNSKNVFKKWNGTNMHAVQTDIHWSSW